MTLIGFLLESLEGCLKYSFSPGHLSIFPSQIKCTKYWLRTGKALPKVTQVVGGNSQVTHLAKLRPQVNRDDDDSPGCLGAHEVQVTDPPTNKAAGDCLVSCKVRRGVFRKVLSKYNSVCSIFSLTWLRKSLRPPVRLRVWPWRPTRSLLSSGRALPG